MSEDGGAGSTEISCSPFLPPAVAQFYTAEAAQGSSGRGFGMLRKSLAYLDFCPIRSSRPLQFERFAATLKLASVLWKRAGIIGLSDGQLAIP